MKATFLTLGTLVLASSLVFAQTGMKTPTKAGAMQKSGAMKMGTMKIGKLDRTFMEKASHSDWAEITMAKLAMKMSKNPKVIDYAKKMVEDHTNLHTKLQALAKEKGVKLPEAPDAMQKKAAAMLAKHVGTAFDRQYFNINLKGHAAAYVNCTKAAKTAKDPDVKAYFAAGCPIIKSHLDMAAEGSKSPRAGMGNMKSGMKKG